MVKLEAPVLELEEEEGVDEGMPGLTELVTILTEVREGILDQVNLPVLWWNFLHPHSTNNNHTANNTNTTRIPTVDYTSTRLTKLISLEADRSEEGEEDGWTHLASLLFILDPLHPGTSLPHSLLQSLLVHHSHRVIVWYHRLRVGWGRSPYLVRGEEERRIGGLPWEYLVTSLLIGEGRKLGNDRVVGYEGYEMVAPLLYEVGQGPFHQLLDCLVRTILTRAMTYPPSPTPVTSRMVGYPFLSSLSDREVPVLITGGEEEPPKTELYTEILNYINRKLSNHEVDSSPAKKKFLQDWKVHELSKLPTLTETPPHQPVDDNANLPDLLEFYPPHRILTHLRDTNRRRVALIVIDHFHQATPSELTPPSPKSTTTSPQRLFKCVTDRIYSLLHQLTSGRDATPLHSQLQWYLDLILFSLHEKVTKNTLIRDITSQIKHELTHTPTPKVKVLMRLAWLVHRYPITVGEDLESHPIEAYGLWLKRLIQSTLHKIELHTKMQANLIRVFSDGLVHDPISVAAEHLKFVRATQAFSTPQFDTYKLRSLKVIREKLGSIPHKQERLKELLTPTAPEKMITLLEAVKLYHGSKRKRELPARLVSAVMFHANWFQSKFIPQLLNSQDVALEPYSQARSELIGILHASGKIPDALIQKSKEFSSPARRVARRIDEAEETLEDGLLASILELGGIFDSFAELIRGSGDSRAGNLTLITQYQISLEKATHTIKTKLGSLPRTKSPEGAVLTLKDLEFDPTGHYLTPKAKYKDLCCGPVRVAEGKVEMGGPYRYPVQVAELFLRFLTLIVVEDTDPTTPALTMSTRNKPVFTRVATHIIQDPLLSLAAYLCLYAWFRHLATSPSPAELLGKAASRWWPSKFPSVLGILLVELELMSYSPTLDSHLFPLPRSSPPTPTQDHLCPLLTLLNLPRLSWPTALLHELLCWDYPLLRSSPHLMGTLITFLQYRVKERSHNATPTVTPALHPIVSYLLHHPVLSLSEATRQPVVELTPPPYLPFLAWVHLERGRPTDPTPTHPVPPIDDSEFLFSHLRRYSLPTSTPSPDSSPDPPPNLLLPALQARVHQATTHLTTHPTPTPRPCPRHPTTTVGTFPHSFLCPTSTPPPLITPTLGLPHLLTLLDADP